MNKRPDYEADLLKGREHRLPPGQTLTRKFPVLTFGPTPRLDKAGWSFRAGGLVEEPRTWSWAEFLALGESEVMADFHCVTTWSRFDNLWQGVPFKAVVAQLKLKPGADYVMVHCHGSYTTNLPLAVLMDDDVLFAHKHDGQDLEAEHGGPMRLIVPKKYAWKSAKWVSGIEFMERNQPGFWEQNGYHMDADPFKEERFG